MRQLWRKKKLKANEAAALGYKGLIAPDSGRNGTRRGLNISADRSMRTKKEKNENEKKMKKLTAFVVILVAAVGAIATVVAQQTTG